MKKNKNNKGFSLVELVIVVAILAILVGLLAPQYTKYVERSRKSADASNIDNIVTAIKVSAADQSFNIAAGSYTIELTKDNCKVTINKSNQSDNAEDIVKALNEYLGKTVFTKNQAEMTASSIKLKSSKWGADSIKATVIVETSGAVVVDSYSPEALKTFMSTGKEAEKTN
ncbi:MAG: prepilin-type N-terminal cleavage/methylation domain-containing protein [Eubacteriales bacterium]|nr:prepilin-type N-terminal cleavage/methylation domain-containing protein [Eubacteriales bacterium]